MGKDKDIDFGSVTSGDILQMFVEGQMIASEAVVCVKDENGTRWARLLCECGTHATPDLWVSYDVTKKYLSVAVGGQVISRLLCDIQIVKAGAAEKLAKFKGLAFDGEVGLPDMGLAVGLAENTKTTEALAIVSKSVAVGTLSDETPSKIFAMLKLLGVTLTEKQRQALAVALIAVGQQQHAENGFDSFDSVLAQMFGEPASFGAQSGRKGRTRSPAFF